MARNDASWYLTDVKRACRRYGMFSEGDRVALGVSGGKDSAVLLWIVSQLQRHLPVRFSVHPVFIDLGFGMDTRELGAFCEQLGYPLTVEKTEIRTIVFDIRREKNPCALCAKLRKGALVRKAHDLGCGKLALGHHLDDAMETFFLNMIYTGKLASFAPRIHLDRRDVTLIRPMVYLRESVVTGVARKHGLPVLPNPCPADGTTKRQEMKGFVAGITERYPGFPEKFRSAMENLDRAGIWALDHPGDGP